MSHGVKNAHLLSAQEGLLRFQLMDTILSISSYLSALADPVSSAFAKLFSRFHWFSLFSAMVLAAGFWLWLRRSDPATARVGLIGFLFPKKVWLHRSAILDYRFVLIDKLLLGTLLAVGAVLLVPGAGEALLDAGDEVIEEVVTEVREDVQASLGLIIAYTAALLLTEDFFRYWAHRLMHASPLLWQFHKVHHSPQVLVPFSQMRTHPVNGLVNLVRSAVSIGLVTGIFLLVFPGELNAITILGINAGRFVFDATGSHLRHSHVWVSWGRILSHVVISPAQHQIHHSRSRRHWNRNYGSQFALWDWLFGTLYVPRGRERLLFGISEGEMNRLRTVRQLYLEPFRDAARLIRKRSAVMIPSRPRG
jgi:sterol desaturase/sphingolipid hydroxylase (fatty acid hydroxylase superfamily)